MLTRFCLLLSLLGLGACAHSVHLYQADNSRSFDGQLIEAQTEQKVILGFTNETLYVERAFDELKRKCENGRIEGINTRYSTSLGFLSWTNKIRMRGYCLKGQKVAVVKKPRRPGSVEDASTELDFREE